MASVLAADGTESLAASLSSMASRSPAEVSLNEKSPSPDRPPAAFERVTRNSEEVPLLRSPVFWIALAIVIGLGAGLYFWENRPVREEISQAQQPQPASAPEAVVAEPAPAPDTQPQIQHPMPEAAAAAGVEPKALPPLDASDEAVQQSLTGAFGKQSFAGVSLSEELIRHLVATVDGLPRDHVPTQRFPLRPPPGRLVTSSPAGLPASRVDKSSASPEEGESGGEETVVLTPGNYARYARYIKLAQALDTKKLVAVYTRYYPLFQQAYAELGYPNRYFNDRVVEVIDHLLAAPEVQGPVELVRFGPFYEFAEPELEELSAGRKLLVRMGPENAAALKGKLRELRREIAATPPT